MKISKAKESLKSFVKKLENFLNIMRQRPIKLNVWMVLVKYWKHLAAINGINWDQIIIERQVGIAPALAIPHSNQWKSANNIFQTIDSYLIEQYRITSFDVDQLSKINLYIWFDNLTNDVSDDQQKLSKTLTKIHTISDQLYEKIKTLVDQRHSFDRTLFNTLYYNQPISDHFRALINSEFYLKQNLDVLYQPIKPLQTGILSWSLLFKQLLSLFAYRHQDVVNWKIGVDPVDTQRIDNLEQGQTEASVAKMVINIDPNNFKAKSMLATTYEDHIEAYQLLTTCFVKNFNIKPIYEHYQNALEQIKKLYKL